MENPASWGKAEQVIDKEYREWYDLRAGGMVGLSLARRVADALRAEGLLAAEEAEHHHGKHEKTTDA
jgi:hypothetical protein